MAEGTARFNICLMGTPDIGIGGIPFTLNRLKANALLFYLAATGQAYPRDHLAALLWGESGQSEAYHSLRSSLYHLRKALRAGQMEDALIRDGEWIGLHPASYVCDVIEFHRLVAQGDESALSQAITLYRGPFLQGFTITEAPMFDDWVQMESTRLNNACLEALERLAASAEAHEAATAATGYTRQIIQIDPLAEAAQQRLMRLYLRQGEIGLALRQYRQFEAQLQQVLGIAPSPDTKALLEDILRQQRNPKAKTEARASTLPASFSTTPTRLSRRQSEILPFVGRENLIKELSTIAEDAKAGSGATVLIQGEGGIGKTRLLDEFASRLIAGSHPWMVLQGACSPFDDLLTYGPFIEALQYGTADDLNDLLATSNTSAPDARGRFFWGVLETIRSITRTAPVLLFIDDLQWANGSTLNLFGFLSMRLRHLPLMLVGTVQHADAIPALQRLITLGRRRRELHLFSLSPLTRKAIADLLQGSAVTPHSVETLSEWLESKSAGNPFLLSEILAQLRAEAILIRASDGLQNEGWQLDTLQWLKWRSTFSLPETTHDLVGWRLANISPDERNLLDVLAVAAQTLSEPVLRSIPGIRAESLPSLVDDLLARGLIMEVRGTTNITLPHHLLAETLLHPLSQLRRRAIHRQLAEALEAELSLESNTRLRQIALHAVAGEDIERARRYGMKLLSELPLELTGVEMVDFIRHLYDLLAPTANPDEMVHITRALGSIHQSLGHLEVAGQWHRQTLAWAQKTGDDGAQAEAHFEISELSLMSNDYHTAMREAQDGLATLRATSADIQSMPYNLQLLSGEGHRLLGAALAMEGRDLAAAEEHLQKAVAVHRQTENQGDLCAVLFELGNVAAQRGELLRALSFYDEAGCVAEAGRIHYYHALARNNFAYHSLLLGRMDEAQQAIAQGIKIAEAYELLAALLHLYSTQGEIYLRQKDWREAEESFRTGLALAEEMGSLERQAGYRGGLALAARGRKDLETARRLLEEALALIAEEGYWHLRTRLQLWLVETLLDQAHYDEAERLLGKAMEVARAQQRMLLVEQGERLRQQLLTARETEHPE